jgi:hypothetical protein
MLHLMLSLNPQRVRSLFVVGDAGICIDMIVEGFMLAIYGIAHRA